MPEGLPFPRVNEFAALKAKLRETQWELIKGGGHDTEQISRASGGSWYGDDVLVSKLAATSTLLVRQSTSRNTNGMANLGVDLTRSVHNRCSATMGLGRY